MAILVVAPGDRGHGALARDVERGLDPLDHALAALPRTLEATDGRAEQAHLSAGLRDAKLRERPGLGPAHPGRELGPDPGAILLVNGVHPRERIAVEDRARAPEDPLERDVDVGDPERIGRV